MPNPFGPSSFRPSLSSRRRQHFPKVIPPKIVSETATQTLQDWTSSKVVKQIDVFRILNFKATEDEVQELFGVTGTLGGDHDRDFLRGLFDVGSMLTEFAVFFEELVPKPHVKRHWGRPVRCAKPLAQACGRVRSSSGRFHVPMAGEGQRYPPRCDSP